MNTKKWLQKNTSSLNDKWVAVSGTTGGIGKHIAYFVAYLGGNILFLNRNKDKTMEQIKELCSKFPNLKIKVITVDMEDTQSVFSAAEYLRKFPLYALIHNAGAYSIKRRITESGFDNLFQINFVSPYILTKELLPTIRENSGKVVVVGSIAHNYSKTNPDSIDFSDIKANSLTYGNAKRFLIFSHFGLFENEQAASLSVTHPGITFTNITAHYPRFIFAIIKHPMKIIFQNPKRAALSVIKGLFDTTDKNYWIGPKIFNIWGLPSKKRLKTCSETESKFIFKISEEIYKAKVCYENRPQRF